MRVCILYIYIYTHMCICLWCVYIYTQTLIRIYALSCGGWEFRFLCLVVGRAGG